MELKNVIVIGASAGGLKATIELVKKIPADLPVAIFVVIHVSKASMPQIIIQQLQKYTTYRCLLPQGEEKIQVGCLYFAPPDFHLLVKADTVKLIKGPHENRWRPSIDVLFRSAAAAFNSRVIGIVLSGMLDDGTSGMSAIKRSGGTCIVQEPAEAEYTDMPQNVLNNVAVDYRVPVADMGYIIDDVVSKPLRHVTIPEDIKLEAEITERMSSDITELKKIGEQSDFTCPDCGGSLFQIKEEKHPRFRCFTGHVYTGELLMEKQGEAVEESLWISIRMLEERRNLLLNLGRREAAGNIMDNYQDRADELEVHIKRLKDLLVTISKTGLPDDGYV
jgi:two-component system chemotaxis response regulator CheB